MQKRAMIFFAVLLFGFCGLISRFLSLAENPAAQTLSGQSTATVTVAAARGTIYDRNLNPFVNDTVETRLCVAPYPQTVSALAEVMPKEQFSVLAERLRGGRPVVAQVEDELTRAVEGVLTFRTPVRNGSVTVAPHLVGYLAADGVNGATGMELAYNAFLQSCGGAVTATYHVNAAGGLLLDQQPTVSDTLGNARSGVVLTIDRELQIFAQSAAQPLKKGAVVILDAATSQTLAAVSVPSFQPNTVADLLEDPDSPLLDRTLCRYNCGSVFKIVTAAAALESGIPVSRRYTCNGSVTVDGVVFHCHNRLGHGDLNMQEAFAASCNCYFIRLAQDTGADTLYYMASLLGFDRAVLLAEDYQTARAVLPSAEELRSSGAALANLSFGQGELLATPYHLAQLAAAVVNGGRLQTPTVLFGTADAAGNVTKRAETPLQTAFSHSTAAALQQMMVAAVGKGSTGEEAAPINGGAGGKTGTAETGWYTENGQMVQSWFVGFYPANAPQYVVAVLAEDSDTTGASAAAVFHRICDGLYTFLR